MTRPHHSMVILSYAQAHMACDALIDAYCKDPQDVEWSDIQDALGRALRAYGLPDSYCESVYARENNTEDGT